MYLLGHGCGSFGHKTCALSTSPCRILISSYHIDTGVHGLLAFSFITLPLPFLISFSNFLVPSCDYLRIIYFIDFASMLGVFDMSSVL